MNKPRWLWLEHGHLRTHLPRLFSSLTYMSARVWCVHTASPCHFSKFRTEIDLSVKSTEEELCYCASRKEEEKSSRCVLTYIMHLVKKYEIITNIQKLQKAGWSSINQNPPNILNMVFFFGHDRLFRLEKNLIFQDVFNLIKIFFF